MFVPTVSSFNSASNPKLLFSLGLGSVSPVDGTTYYLGTGVNWQTVEGKAKFSTFVDCVLTKFDLYLYNSVTGTSEATNVYLRKNATSEILIGSIDFSTITAGTKKFTFNFSQIALITDSFEFKIVCPAWVTNPTVVMASGILSGY